MKKLIGFVVIALFAFSCCNKSFVVQSVVKNLPQSKIKYPIVEELNEFFYIRYMDSTHLYLFSRVTGYSIQIYLPKNYVPTNYYPKTL